MDNDRSFRCGTPSLEEWKGRWKYSPTDQEVTDSEYDEVWSEFERRLADHGNTRSGPGQEFYFRGDNYGDRTQYLEIRNVNRLTTTLLKSLQDWLREPRFRQWRVMIVTYLGDEAAIMVYPSIIRVGQRYGVNVSDALIRIVEDMKKASGASI